MDSKETRREALRASIAELSPRELAARDQLLQRLRAYYDEKNLSFYDLDTRFGIVATVALLADAYKAGEFEWTTMGMAHLLMETQTRIDDRDTTKKTSEV